MARIFDVDINDLLHEDEEFSMPEKEDEAYDDYKVLRQSLNGIKKPWLRRRSGSGTKIF